MRPLSIVVGAIALMLCTGTLTGEDLHAELSTLLDTALPGQRLVPTPFGADERFRPRSLWMALGLARPGDAAEDSRVWALVSSGRALYPDDLVPVQSRRIELKLSKASVPQKIALASALLGQLGKPEFERGWAADLEVKVTLDGSVVDYVYPTDLKGARDLRQLHVAAWAPTETSSENRVIVAIVRVTGGSVTVRAPATSTGDRPRFLRFLSDLGFVLDRNRQTFGRVEFDGDRTIAFQAQYSTGRVPGVPAGQTRESTPAENQRILADLSLGK